MDVWRMSGSPWLLDLRPRFTDLVSVELVNKLYSPWMCCPPSEGFAHYLLMTPNYIRQLRAVGGPLFLLKGLGFLLVSGFLWVLFFLELAVHSSWLSKCSSHGFIWLKSVSSWNLRAFVVLGPVSRGTGEDWQSLTSQSVSLVVYTAGS